MFFKNIFAVFFAVLPLFLFFPSDVLSSHGRHTEKIPDAIVSVSSGYVIAVDKKMQKLYVFKKNEGFSKVFETSCSTGKNQGSKLVSGDAKTPTGIFFATRMIDNPGPPETYGTLAFPLDYPTITDKKSGKNGTNIWIHGTIKPVVPFQSNGCVVLNDRDIHALARFIHLNKTPVVIAETIQWVPQNQTLPVKDELEKVLTAWIKGYTEGNISVIDRLYLKDYQIKGKKRNQLLGSLSNIKNINQHFFLEPKDISILQQNDDAVIVFDQITDINKDNTFRGSFNKLALQKINNRWLILDETTIPAPVVQKADRPATPRPEAEATSQEAVKKLINQWAESWESGNMSSFRACYAADFRSQGMNLDEWINHKIYVRKHSKNIKVRVSDLSLSVNNDRSTATFTQYYRSSLLTSKGAKKLEMKKTNGAWKIYRETMR